MDRDEIGKVDRHTLVADCNKGVNRNVNKQEYKNILDYNVQYKQFKRIVLKHWAVLRNERILGAVLHSRPRFIYRQAATLRDVIAPGVVDPPIIRENMIFFLFVGFLCLREMASLQTM